jgi:hypothetical protein
MHGLVISNCIFLCSVPTGVLSHIYIGFSVTKYSFAIKKKSDVYFNAFPCKIF